MLHRDVFVRSHIDMVQLEQYEPTPLVSAETEPNVEVNMTKHTLLICDFFNWFAIILNFFSGSDTIIRILVIGNEYNHR